MPWTKISHVRGPKPRTWVESTDPKDQRWVNDIGRVRVTFPNADRLADCYSLAREHGYTPELAARYAIHSVERGWHSVAYDINLEPRKSGKPWTWMVSTRIDASVERLLKVLSNTCRGQVTLEDLESRTLVSEFMLRELKKGQPKFFKSSQKAVMNYYRIFGDQTEVSEDDLLWRFVSAAPMRKEWLKIRRGEDLFTLWKFDIREVLVGFSRVILEPDSIRYHAYGINPRYFTNSKYDTAKERKDRIRQYIMRWQDWWKRDNHGARVDELPYDTLTDEQMTTHPETLTRQVHEERLERERIYQEGLPKPEHVYAVAKKFTTKVNCETALIPIRTYGELVEVGNDLHNCARNYHCTMETGRDALIALRDLETMKPLALGCLDTKSNSWVQIAGPCNQKVSKETHEFYDSYLGEKT